MHVVNQLFGSIHEVEPYPPGVIAVPSRIPGTAFFPGGAGLWGMQSGDPMPPMPVNGVMVLGHDFHSEDGFRTSLAQGTEVPATPSSGQRIPPTWTNLHRLLSEAGIPMERCFFTNAYMGLRKGSGTTGRFPGSRDSGFVDRCRHFLLRQIAAQHPATILTLGAWVPAFIAPLSSALARWTNLATMNAVDTAGPVILGAEFGSSGATCTVIALTHPSLRGPNVGRRQHDGVTGHAAELAMLRAVSF